MTLDSFYGTRREEFAAEESKYLKRTRLFASFRLITAFFVLGVFWQAIANAHLAWFLLMPAGVLLFIFLVRFHAGSQQKRQYFQRLKVINENEAGALQGNLSVFPDGASRADTSHPFTYDLDIFGRNSIFQLINRTCCVSGEDLLAGNLADIPAGTEGILKRQKAISELARLTDFRQHFMATGQGVTETPEETRQLYSWMAAGGSRINSPGIRLITYLFPAAAFLLLLLALTGVLSHAYWVVCVLVNLFITGLFLGEINRIHAVVSGKHRLLEKFGLLLQHTGKQSFNDAFLESLRKEGLEAFGAIQRLAGTINFFDQRLNMVAGALLNGFLLSDLHCVMAIDRWRGRYSERMPSWLNSIFRMDELNSFANFAFNHPHYCYPVFHEASFIEAEQLGHPLIPAGHCVTNDFSPRAGEKVVILTGANMSGKSTFLRSIGVNLVLAYAGAPVFASRFRCSLAGICSSMRVSDSLSEDTSYFYAELKRLSMIMDRLRSGEKLVILLDEILKGTNSADKLYGSTGLVEEFIGHDCFCMIATHDLELGKLEEKHPREVSNYCFESALSDEELQFDYTVRKGIARNKNATFLMKKTGLIR